jgi:hypothetical protein
MRIEGSFAALLGALDCVEAEEDEEELETELAA